MCFGVLCVQDSWHMNTIFLLRLRPCIASSYLIICHTDVSALFVDHLLGMAKPLLQRMPGSQTVSLPYLNEKPAEC